MRYRIVTQPKGPLSRALTIINRVRLTYNIIVDSVATDRLQKVIITSSASAGTSELEVRLSQRRREDYCCSSTYIYLYSPATAIDHCNYSEL